MSISRIGVNARMSAIVIHNQTVYLSGQVAEDVSADIKEQTRTTLSKIDALLSKAGSSRENVISAIIYLRDIDNHFTDMNDVWDAWFVQGCSPARACVEAHMARPSALVEISVVAAVNE